MTALPSLFTEHRMSGFPIRAPCTAALSFCLPVHNAVRRIFEHVPPCHSLAHPSNFSVAPAEIRDSNIFEDSSMILSFGLHSP